VVAAFYLFVYRDRAQNDAIRLFYRTEVHGLRERYGEAPPPLVEYDDGVVAYLGGFPALSGFGFTADAEAVRHLQQHTLLPLAQERGIERLACYTYYRAKGDRPGTPSDSLWARFRATFSWCREDFSRYRLEVDYASPTGRFSVLRFEEEPSRP
jgi:hypothetical protein